MLDFSRAEGSRNHRSSFLKTTSNIINFIESIKSKYLLKSDELEIVRKERAAIIEETIQLLKNAKIRLGKQLGRCNNDEINKELLTAINALNDDTKEKIQINLIKINNRYSKIQELGKELERLSGILAHYRVLESDYDDEVVITLPKKETLKKADVELPQKEETTDKSKSENLEAVVDIHAASEPLLNNFNQKFEKEEIEIPSSVEKEALEDLYTTKELLLIQDELEHENISQESLLEESPNEQESILFTINDKLTLKEIAKNVYQSEDNWEAIYSYANNSKIIDDKAIEYDKDIEEIVSNPGYLANITLEFPTLLAPEEKKSKKSGRRVA